MNKKALNKFKDETNGKPPKEFVGLRSKMYSLLLSNDTQKSTIKGIKRQYAKKHLKHDDYKDCLVNQTENIAKFLTIRSKNHELKTVRETKISLSCYDDKRYIFKDDTATLAYGHYGIPK